MSIDEAISHAREVADTRTDMCDECRDEHRQLAEWLEELKIYKESNISITDDIEKSNFNPQMLKSCTDTSYECGYYKGRTDALDEFWTKFDKQIKSKGKQMHFYTEFLRIGMNIKDEVKEQKK